MARNYPLRAWLVLAATLVGVAVTARLGMWQLSRAAQKEVLQAQLDAQQALPPLPVAELASDAQTAATQHQRHIVLRGRWIDGRTVFLDNRAMAGRAGFYVLTPLQLEGADGVVVVQRGWVPRDAQDRTRLPPVATPAGDVRIEGRIAPPPSRLLEMAEGEVGTIRQNLDLDAFARETGLPLRPLTVVQEQASGAAADDGLLRQWPRPAVDVHKHYGYAFQWFALAALMTGLYVWFQLVRPRRRA